jgi:sugar (pentulose or hexulose) kinase
VRSSRRLAVACGVDIGSTNIKVVAIDPDGVVVGRASRPTPRGEDGVSIEGTLLLATVEMLVSELCGDSLEIHAICCAGVGEDGMLVDAQLRPLTPALAWFDPRRQGIFRDLRPELTDDDTFDAPTDPARTMIGWAWARRQVHDAGASTWVAVADFPAVSWTRQPFLSDTLASRTGAWRSGDRTWSSERVALTLGDHAQLPPVISGGEIVGGVDSPVLQAAGVLADDVLMVSGGHDHPLGGWGVGLSSPGAILDSMGTAEVVVAQSVAPAVRRTPEIDIAPGIRSAKAIALRVEELSRNVAWASQDPEVATAIRHLLEGTMLPEPILDAGYFLPGHRGGGAPSYALDAPRDPRARASAVLGALAYAGREAIEAVCGEVEARGGVLLAGGWARSPGWVTIKETVNGYVADCVPEPEVTAVAAALLAAAARGWSPDPEIAFGSNR